MPVEFWAEAVSCVVYLINISPTKGLNNSTLNEAWYGRKPSIHHLRIFDRISFSHISSSLRTKLEDKFEKKKTYSLATMKGVMKGVKLTSFTIRR